VLGASVERIMGLLGNESRVLDVGGGARPFRRADVVLDLMPYESRGELGAEGPGAERFTADTWVQHDICAREPWPFGDKEFDFAICSQTLEDVRDPIWVCSELVRVAKAGYIETPSRLEEQSFGIQGPWVGWGHHHWLVETEDDRVRFIFKHHVVHGRASAYFPVGFGDRLSDAERVNAFFWKDGFSYEERMFFDDSLDGYLDSFVSSELARRGLSRPAPARPSLPRRAIDLVGGRIRR